MLPIKAVHAWPAALALATCTVLISACSPQAEHDPGLLAAPGFIDETGRLVRPWSFQHHATLGSYRLTVTDGELTIERIGAEPSATLVQDLPAEAVADAAGRTLVFGADFRARLENDTWGPPLSPTGMIVRVESPPEGGASDLAARLGSARRRVERLDLPSPVVIDDWTRHELVFDVPEDVQRMSVSFSMTSGGVLEIRNPSLTVVEP
jgi:hypothetical protein